MGNTGPQVLHMRQTDLGRIAMTTAHRLSVSLLALFLVAELTGVTLALPGDFLVPLPPGYNQVRYDIVGCEDLPENGGAYCGPTSSAILLKWLDENGYPGVGTWGESCCEVSDALRDLGTSMSCHPTGGTTTTNMRNALQDILDDSYPGQFDVGYIGRHSADLWEQQAGRDFTWIAIHLNFGHLVVANIGWYDLACPDFPGKRCGGHYVAVTGYDWVNPEYWVRFRDPVHRFIACDVFAASATCSTRDDECIERWRTSLEAVELQDTGDGCVNERVTASRWHWDRNERPGDFCDVEGLGCGERLPYQDGFVYIGGTRLFSRPQPGAAYILSYNLAAGTPGTHSSGTSTIYTTVKKHPWLFELYHCQPGEDDIFITDLGTDAVRTLTTTVTINQPRRLVFGSDGTLYVLQSAPSGGGALISAIDPEGSLVGQVAPGSFDDDIAYHEKLERVYAWDGYNGRLQAYTTTLEPVGTPITLTTDTSYTGLGYLAVDPTGDILYYNHDGDEVIFRFDLASGTALSSLSDTELSDPAEMALDNRGHVYVAQGTTPAKVLEFDRSGNLVTNSAAAAFTANTNLTITRSTRTPLLDPNELNPQNLNVDSVDEEEDIPTVSEWGLVVMALLMLTAGTIVYARRHAHA